MPQLGNLVLDFSSNAAVRESLLREKRNHLLYVSLGSFAAAMLLVMVLWDGLNLVDGVFLAVVVLLLVFVASSVDALVGFDAMNPGLRVFELGLALPWRGRKAAARGEENVALYSEIREIRVLRSAAHANLIVAWKAKRRPQSFLIESKWIPDIEAFLHAVRGKVEIREA